MGCHLDGFARRQQSLFAPPPMWGVLLPVRATASVIELDSIVAHCASAERAALTMAEKCDVHAPLPSSALIVYN